MGHYWQIGKTWLQVVLSPILAEFQLFHQSLRQSLIEIQLELMLLPPYYNPDILKNGMGAKIYFRPDVEIHFGGLGKLGKWLTKQIRETLYGQPPQCACLTKKQLSALPSRWSIGITNLPSR